MKTLWKTVPHKNWGRARKMRLEPSPPEQRLWDALKDHATGAHFRRQHPIGVYIVDFCAPRHRLVIEVDGFSHAGDQAQENDASRDEFLQKQGFQILRFTSHDVMNNLSGVVAVIRENVQLNPPAPKTSFGGEKEKRGTK